MTTMHIEAEILLSNTRAIDSLLSVLPTTDKDHPTVRKLEFRFRPERHALVVCMEITSDNFVRAEEIAVNVLSGVDESIRRWAKEQDDRPTVKKHGSFLVSA